MYLDEIKTHMIKDFMMELSTRYKPKIVSNCVTLTGNILKWAFEEEFIEHNPYLGIKNHASWKKTK